MATYAALLRAINVGGRTSLSMNDLRALCADAGLENARTYIQSGNLVFSSALSRAKVQKTLEKALAAKMGHPVGVHLRTSRELASVIQRNPFKRVAPNRLLVFFLERAPSRSALAAIEIPGREALKASGRELFVHYPDGMGGSKLRLPFVKTGTGRNLNTVRRLLELARAPGD